LSLDALFALKDDNDFHSIITEVVREIERTGMEKFGSSAWMVAAQHFQHVTGRTRVISQMTSEDMIEWTKWAFERGHWHPKPEEMIAWAMRRRGCESD
jgi:hypothetical protein